MNQDTASTEKLGFALRTIEATLFILPIYYVWLLYAKFFPFIQSERFESLTNYDSPTYKLGVHTDIYLEISYRIAVILLFGALFYLFQKRSKYVPKLLYLYTITSILYVLFDTLMFGRADLVSIIRPIFWWLIITLFLIRSRRVKELFIK